MAAWKPIGGADTNAYRRVRLESLDLSRNFLNGSIPGDMKNLLMLTYLDLSMNLLNGVIPMELFEMRLLDSLFLGYNAISGQLPEQVSSFRLQVINLTHNNLHGEIPKSILELTRISTLDLSGNRLSGGVESLVRLRSISVLRVCSGFEILFYLGRKYWLEKHGTSASTREQVWPSLSDDGDEWKMITFQRLKFNKAEILSSLTDQNLIGSGGSGKVFRVCINEGSDVVAIKSMVNPRKPNCRLDKEFLAEIKTLGTIWHNNIVKLICYLSSNEVKLLVYQYVENTSLHQWLHGRNRGKTPVSNSSVMKLDWPMRLHIAIGAAQGLCYMHHDCSPTIIHRDIKSRNILLDSEFNAKIADFGLSKLLNGQGDTETASNIAGTFGYIAPEYAYTTKVNRKTDIYSFGVVLLELTTGREAVTYGDHMNLAERAHLRYKDTNAVINALDDEITDPIYVEQIVTVFQLGLFCTAQSPSDRPSMKDCLHVLKNCSSHPSSDCKNLE